MKKRRYDDYVVVVPFTLGRKVLIQKQYKDGVGKICNGFPAGFVKTGESPMNAAKRELMEEEGMRGFFTPVGQFYDNVSIGGEMFSIFFCLRDGKIFNAKNPDALESPISSRWISYKKLENIVMYGACMELAKRLFLSFIDRTARVMIL